MAKLEIPVVIDGVKSIEEFANRVLDDYEFKGKTIREWADRIANPETNGDRIRAMTDEELAELFTSFYYDGPKFYCPAVADVGEGKCAAVNDCHECFLNWLK